MNPESLGDRMSRRAADVNAALRRYLAADDAVPARLAEAMRYSVEAGGKRVRPFLVLECCELCGGTDDAAMPAAAAIECAHTFSLIHDDLPAMDDDDLRRGRPTNHRVFGEATAILAGDALLTLAFQLLACEVRPAQTAREMVRTLAQAVGWRGMIGGQMLDLNVGGAVLGAAGDAAECVKAIHEYKTARLIAAACRLGGLAAGAAKSELSALEQYGRRLGLAFQAVDDLLDRTGTSRALGKTAGKDDAAGKLTLPRAVGEDEAWRIAERCAADAAAALDVFGAKARPLIELSQFVVDRSC